MARQKIIIAGGSGFLGHAILKALRETDTEWVVLTRGESAVRHNISFVHWDATTPGEWQEVLEDSTAVINLVGKSVNCRYTEKNKQEIISSRVQATRLIGEACRDARHPPKVWINAGSAAIFGDTGDEIKNEDSVPGEGFSPEVCKEWEAAFHAIDTPRTRKVFLRMGLVFQKGEGLLGPFIKMAKLGLGGAIGSGRQYISWVHEQDFTHLIQTAIERDNFSGVIHCVSPYPVTNDQFMKALRQSLRIPFGLPNPSLLIKAGAVFIGTEADLVLSGRRVVSKVLWEKKFLFRFAHIEEALNHLIG